MIAMVLMRKSKIRHLVRSVVGLGLIAVLVGFAGDAVAHPLTLSPVGAPIPANVPVGVAIAETRGGTYAVIADFGANQVRSLRMDPPPGRSRPWGRRSPSATPRAT